MNNSWREEEEEDSALRANEANMVCAYKER